MSFILNKLKPFITTGFLSCILILFLIQCRNKDEHIIQIPEVKSYEILNQWGIIMIDKQRLRELPQVKSKTITYIPRYTLVEISNRSTQTDEIEKKSDYWYQILWEGEKGWIFGAFLKKYNTYQDALKMKSSLESNNQEY